MEKSFKQKNCMEYCNFILVNNPKFKKEIIDYIEKSNKNDSKIDCAKNYSNNNICKQILSFTKD
tara:strand:+ start:3025 stop:3216 length:192 start_codon:yes stop_codon:yes gene_type:complete